MGHDVPAATAGATVRRRAARPTKCLSLQLAPLANLRSTYRTVIKLCKVHLRPCEALTNSAPRLEAPRAEPLPGTASQSSSRRIAVPASPQP